VKDMPAPQIHGEIDIELFGHNYFDEVHKWIDGSFNGTNGRTHWVNRHYVQAIMAHFNSKDYPDELRRQRLIEVAKFHVLIDWIWYYKQIVLPQTREDVIKELAKNGVLVE
jgi:hypothetical protein